MKNFIQIQFLILFLIGNVVGQNEAYSSRSAALQIRGEFSGESLVGKTQELAVILNYETAEITLRFPANSLETNSDSLNSILAKSTTELFYQGKLGMEYINTDDHPPMKFTTEGWLKIDDSEKQVIGEGELHHVENGGQVACLLGLTMNLNFKDLNIPIPIPGIEENFSVIITQALLEKDRY